MAPPSAGGDGSGGATRSSARQRRRERSVAELKGDVLSLVRRTRSALSSERDGALYETHCQRFHGACHEWVVTIFASAGNTVSAGSSSTMAIEKQQQTVQAVMAQLAMLTQFVTSQQQRGCGESRELVGVIVRSIGATTEIIKRRRKRKLPTSLQVISSAASSTGDAGTSAAISRVAELFGVWLLHSSGVLRLEDVLLGVAASSGAAEPWEWLTAPVHFLLDRAAQRLHLSSLPVPATTHGVVEAVLLHIIRLAFTDSRPARAPYNRGDHSQGFSTSHASEQAAMQILEELCFFTSARFSIPTLRLVTQILSKRAMLQDEQAQAAPNNNNNNNFGRLAIAQDRVVSFLQPQIAQLVSLVQAAYTHDELEHIFSAYQSCLSTSTFVQIVRQFIYEANSESSSRDTNPDAAVSEQPHSVICNALYQLITSLAVKRSDFVDHVLTLAHDLASEGIQGMNGFLLRHSLELVAAVSSSVDVANGSSSSAVAVDCYRDWVRDHFAAQDASTRKQSLDIVTSSEAALSTDAPAPLRCLKQRDACSLVTSKRQIQYLCAFLLEFDRREQPGHHSNAGAIALRPIAKSNHVAAHLSVMKTHQPQFTSGGLVMDFCSQTRSRYLELLKIEQATTAATNLVENSSASTLQNGKKQRDIVSLHSAKVCNMVREHIQLHRDSKKLSPQLRQWKMFQPQLWKQELIPCCLDIEFDNLSRAASSCREDGGGDRCAAESKLLEHVAFVHALAKIGLVTMHEYSQFLVSAEEWLESTQRRRNLKKRSYKRPRHGTADGEGLDHALAQLQLEMAAEKNGSDLRRRKRASAEAMDKLRGALASTFELVLNAAKASGGPLQSASITFTQQMQTLWEEGCVRVARVLGLDQLDAFFAYLVPVFGQPVPPSQENLTGATPCTASQQDKSDGTMAHALIAQFFASQISWTEQRVDERFLYEVSSLAAVVAALLGACDESQSLCSMSDIARLIERIDEKCVPSDGSSVSSSLLLPHDQLLRRFLFYSTMLRAANSQALGSRDTRVRVVTSLLQCESLKPEIRDFLSWVGYRSMVATGASQLTTNKDSQAALQEIASAQPLWLVLANLRVLCEMKWCQEAFSMKKLEFEQLRIVLKLEFRYGLKLFGGASSLAPGASLLPSSVTASEVAVPRQWLQTELDIIADSGAFRIASVESVGEWIVPEILLQVTAPIATNSSSDDDARELRSRDDTVALLLLILDDLMHRLNLQQAISSAHSANNPGFATKDQGSKYYSRNHGRIVAYFAGSVLELIQESGGVFPVTPRLQHHGFEVLEICARHQIDRRHARDLSGGDKALLELMSEIVDHFQSHFPWPLLQTLFFYLMRLLQADNIHRDTDAPVIGIRDLPTSIVIRCAIEYPRLRTVWERCGATSSDMGTGKESSDFMRYLEWIHQFSRQVIECAHDELDVGREYKSGGSALSKAELTLPHGMDAVKYQTLILKYLFRWNLLQVPDLTTQSHLVKPFFVESAGQILRALNAHNEPMLSELAACFVGEWLEIAFTTTEEEKKSSPARKPKPVDFHFQLFLVHAVVELCKRSAQVSKTLLRSWRKATSSVKTDGSALFIALLAIAMSGNDDDSNTTSPDQFDQVLEMNSSIWGNAFPQIALHVLSVGLVSSETAEAAIESNSSVAKLIKVIANTQSFKEGLTTAVYKVLRHGVVNQVDVLDAALPRRIRQVWPTLSDIASQLPVMTLDNNP